MSDQLKILKETEATIKATIALLNEQLKIATRQIKKLEGVSNPSTSRKGMSESSLMVLAARRKTIRKAS